MLKNKIKKNQLKRGKTNTYHTCDPGHKTVITPYKANKNNYKSQFTINLMFKDEIEKKKNIQLKKEKNTRVNLVNP
jgi:hypothetical protein